LTQAVGAAEGSFVEDPRRRIQLAGVFNFRDAGGYPVEGGGSVRWRTLFRSDALHRLDAAGAAAVAGLGLRTVLDLRSHAEVEIAPSPVRGRVTHVPLLPDLRDVSVAPQGAAHVDLGGIYRFFVDECAEPIAAAIGELCSDDALPALVHCSAGKDRTGLVVALVLAVLGVPDELIAADYALSAVCLDPSQTPVIGQLRASTGLGEDLTSALLGSPPELIVEVLDRIRARAGSVEQYLRAHGLSDAALSQLRFALIV
jgi:protein-tyrosine phosphatase